MNRRDFMRTTAAAAGAAVAGCGGGPEEENTEEQGTAPDTEESYGETTETTVERTEEPTEVEITEGPSENTPNSDAYDIPRPNRDPDFEDRAEGSPHITGDLPGDNDYRLTSGPIEEITDIDREGDSVPGYDCESDVVFELLSGEDEHGRRDTIDEATLTPDNLDVMLEDTENDLMDIYINRLECELPEEGFADTTYHVEIYMNQ